MPERRYQSSGNGSKSRSSEAERRRGRWMIENLDVHGAWRAPLAQSELIEFERSVADQAADSIRSLEPSAFRAVAPDLKRELRTLWDANNLPRFIGVASAFHRAHRLNPNYMQRLAWALLTQWRFAEAAEVIAAIPQDDHHRWFIQARAMAGSGRLDDAHAAIGRCAVLLDGPSIGQDVKAEVKFLDRRRSAIDLASGWPLVQAEIRRRYKAHRDEEAQAALHAFFRRRTAVLQEAIETVKRGPSRRDWTSLRRYLIGCLLLDLPDLAVEALGGHGDMQASAQALEDAAPLLGAAAAFAPPERQPDILKAIEMLSETAPWRPFAALARQVLSGEAAWEDLVAARLPPAAITAAIAASLARAGAVEAAIPLFGELGRGKKREAEREDLVACQSSATRDRLGFHTIDRPGPRRIFDMFPYNGEIELLKIKLHEMAPWVERFVIVEAATTFSGQPKPLYLASQSAEIAPFLSKITHIVIREFPDHLRSAWAREFYQRDQAAAALKDDCAPDDLILLTDVDEILDRRAIEPFFDDGAPVTMHLFRYFLNYRKNEQHGNASIWRARLFERWGASFLRTLAAKRRWHLRVPDAGWHFTSVGDLEDITRKLASYSHEENNRPDNRDVYAGRLDRIRRGEFEPGWGVCGADVLPAFVRDRREVFAHLFL